MGEDALYRCLMRGLKQNEPPWGERRATPSFEICPYCGTEFGYEDAPPIAARKQRERWLVGVAEWFEPKEKPANLSLREQLEESPEEGTITCEII